MGLFGGQNANANANQPAPAPNANANANPVQANANANAESNMEVEENNDAPEMQIMEEIRLQMAERTRETRVRKMKNAWESLTKGGGCLKSDILCTHANEFYNSVVET